MPRVRAFAAELTGHSQLHFLEPEPRADGEPRECYGNVDRQIAEHGGSKQHGWCIWEWPGAFIEAEFHAVWVDPEGKLHDVTPRDDDEGILFVADPMRRFEGVPIDNVRRALRKDDAIVQYYLALSERFVYEMNHGDLKHAPFGQVELPEALIPLYQALNEAEAAVRHVTDPTTARSAPCRCGSGKTFKRCHGMEL